MAETTMLAVRVPVTLRRQLKLLAAETERTVQDLVRDALRQYLARHGKEV